MVGWPAILKSDLADHPGRRLRLSGIRGPVECLPWMCFIGLKGGAGMQVQFSMLGRAIAVAALSLLGACITNSGPETASTNTAITAFAAVPPKPGSGAVYIGRPSGFNVSYFPVPIEVDGQPLTSVGRGSYVRVELSPGHHVISARDDWWSRSINGKPYPLSLTVEVGKVYYLLPKRWLGPPESNIAIVGNAVVPHQTVRMEGTFSVQASAPGVPPPQEFMSLTSTEANR